MNAVRVPQPAVCFCYMLIFLSLFALISGQTARVLARADSEAIDLLLLAPSAFNKIGPQNGDTGRSASLALVWEPSAGTSSYEYCYDTTNDNACTVWISSSGTSNSAELRGLSPATTYYWHVRAINAGGTTYSNGSETAFWSFTTGNSPGAFTKSSPANGATNLPRWPTQLSWNASSDASSYEYCYDTTNDGACSTWVSTGPVTSSDPLAVGPITTYYWQVRANSANGTTYADESSTAYWSFTTEFWDDNDNFDYPYSPSPFGHTQSVAEYTTTEDDPVLSCSGGQEYLTAWFKYTPTESRLVTLDTLGSSYDTVLAVWTGTRGNLTSVGCNDDGGSDFTSLLSLNVTAGTVYYIEVASYFPSPAGESLSLHISPWDVPPGAFAKTRPVDGAIDQSTRVALFWEASSGASSYEYCYYNATNENGCSSWVSTGTSTSANISGLTPGATYHWQVHAINSYGTTDARVVVGTGDYWSFSVRTDTNNVLWLGKTSLGHPVSFSVSPDGMNWDDFQLDTETVISQSCLYTPLVPVHVTVPGPGSIANNQFAIASDSGFSAAGQFTSPTTATGTYSFSHYEVIWSIDHLPPGDPYYCYYDLNELGTWTAGRAITISGNVGIAEATLSYEVDGRSKTVTADVDGNYSIRVPPGWSGMVTPKLERMAVSFTPESRSYSNVISNQPAQNYTPFIWIAGKTGAAGASLNYVDGTPKSVVSDADGYYEIQVPYNWSGTVTPSLAGVIFTPSDRSYVNVTSHQWGQNYKAAVTLSGNTGVSNVPLSYVDRAAKTATSDRSGNYSIVVPYGWSGTITPSLGQEAFCPTDQTYQNLSSSKAAQNYAHEACRVFDPISRWTNAFDRSHGWTVSDHVRTIGDVNNGGTDDLIGFGLDGVYVATSTSTTFNSLSKWITAFDLAHGWTVQDYVRTTGDVNKDGQADLIGFGQDGVYVATSTGRGFNLVSKWTTAFDLAHGWTVSSYVRTVGDVNGDGMDDLIGFGQDGVYVATSTSTGFNPVGKWITAFDLAHGWTVQDYVRTVGDVNGDGMADLVGFGQDGVYIATSTGTGFNPVSKWITAFDLAHGWTVSQYVRTVGDINGDGKADLVGFGLDGVYVSLSMGNTFSLPSRRTTSFDLSHGWTVESYIRLVSDVSGDGKDDLVGFGWDGVYIAK